jgi:hypothetical protein
MIDKAILAALRASIGNPDAIAALALFELRLAEPPSIGSQKELSQLIDKWGRTLLSVDAADVERLKRYARASIEYHDEFAPALK